MKILNTLFLLLKLADHLAKLLLFLEVLLLILLGGSDKVLFSFLKSLFGRLELGFRKLQFLLDITLLFFLLHVFLELANHDADVDFLSGELPFEVLVLALQV